MQKLLSLMFSAMLLAPVALYSADKAPAKNAPPKSKETQQKKASPPKDTKATPDWWLDKKAGDKGQKAKEKDSKSQQKDVAK